MSKNISPINAHQGAKEGDAQDLSKEYNLVYDGKAWQTDLHHTVPAQTTGTTGSRTMSSATAATSATVGAAAATHRQQQRSQSEIHGTQVECRRNRNWLLKRFPSISNSYIDISFLTNRQYTC